MTDLFDIARFVEASYDIKVLQIAKLTNKTYKLATANQEFLLKFASGDDRFLMKQLYVHKELPDVVLPIYETSNKTRKAEYEEGFAYLTDYVKQSPMPFESRVRDYGRLLNELHLATAVSVDKNDDEISWMYAADYGILEENFKILEQMVNHYEMKLSRSPFEWQVLMMYPIIYGMFRRSDESMKKFYRLLARKKQHLVSINHGDVNVANLLPGSKNNHLINFENSYFDLPTNDMLKFLRHYHQASSTTRTIADYLKEQKDQLLVHHFFMKSTCIDLLTLKKQLSGNALIDISLFNEQLAAGLVAMRLYDEFFEVKKPVKKPQSKKAAEET